MNAHFFNLKKLEEKKTHPWLRHYPRGVTWEIDVPRQTMSDFLRQTAKKHADKPAVSFAGHVYTYAALDQLVSRAAKGLQLQGVKKGVKVGLFLPNSGYSVVMYHAILRAGGTVVNYNPLYVERDLIYQVEDSDTDMLVTVDVPALLEKATALLEKTRVQKIIVCPLQESMMTAQKPVEEKENEISFAAIVHNDGIFADVPVNVDQDIAVLQYTGGTTGTSKGAALTHKALVSNAYQISTWFHNIEEAKDSIIATLPLFHVFAMTVVMNMPLMRGLHMLILPQFDVKEVFRLMTEYKPAYMAGVPTMYITMANDSRVSTVDFSSLKFCLSGGAPLPVEVKNLFEKKTGAKLVAEGYGLTEFTPVATCNPLTAAARPGSIGLPIPGTMVEIISLEDGKTVMPFGEKGELCVSGPQMMQGYYKKPEETEKVIKNGRLHTGDVGYMDEDGFVYIVDRVKDLILVGGYNVYPRHVEEMVYLHPAVKECIVAGVPDPLRGEAVCAWVKPVDGNPLDAATLKAFLHGKLSPIEMPKKIIIRDQPLPKTAVGKLSKKDLLAEEGIVRK